MKKIYALLTAILLVFGVLAACGNDSNPKPDENQNISQGSNESGEISKGEESFPVTIKDARDSDVEIASEPKKIISLMPSNTEVVFALEKGETLVGASTEYDNYPQEADNIEKVAAGFELNVEKVLSLEPDLVLAHESNLGMWEAGIKQIEDSGIKVLVINDAQSFAAVYDSIEMIGKAIGKSAEAEQLNQEMKTKIDELKEKAKSITDQKSVFIEVGVDPIFTTGNNTFMNEMLEIIHAQNVAENQDGWVQMNEEAIVEFNPDVIITTVGFIENEVEEIKKRPAWQDITAVKENQVYLVNEDLVSRSGPRIIEGVEELAKAIYPEVFGE
ncbi:ABC transporter substrate-binding protein [Bacillus niameyensis]|uniref:ABC transporter substrate-binding protein n=1 Tax=Bacillus niameyensis TaxID=1522308 RepID=UPI0007853CE9|nr:ABC transporter substrate-binding protein [Bacillus niameyensis]